MQWHSYETSSELAGQLAHAVASELAAAIKANGKASLAVSGGNTPKQFMQVLAEKDIPWSQVSITLVDERWVGPEHARSNARLVRENLLQNKARHATWVPLYVNGALPGEKTTLKTVAQRLQSQVLPLDVAILGMGNDGHTASFFPGGDYLAQALDIHGHHIVWPMSAEAADEMRITLSLPVLLRASCLFMHIQGQAKKHVLQQALDGGNAPVATVIKAAPEMNVYWCREV